MSLFEKIKPYRYQLILTLLAYLGCGLFAFRSQSIGACLLEFEIQIQEPFSVTSRVFGAYAIGYVSGAFICKLIDCFFFCYLTTLDYLSLHEVGLIEKLLDVQLVSTISCIFAGVAIASMAFTRTFITLGAATIFLGIGNSIFDLGERKGQILRYSSVCVAKMLECVTNTKNFPSTPTSLPCVAD